MYLLGTIQDLFIDNYGHLHYLDITATDKEVKEIIGHPGCQGAYYSGVEEGDIGDLGEWEEGGEGKGRRLRNDIAEGDKG